MDDKEKFLARLQAIEDTKWKIAKQLEAENEALAEEMRKNGEIINTYSCQKCHRDFVTREIYQIILYKQPLCRFCQKEKEDIEKLSSTGNGGGSEREQGNLLGFGQKKILPVLMDLQREIPVDYAIAKFKNKGIAFKSTNNIARCWIKRENVIGRNQFHITLRFQGVDFITQQGSDYFDVDFYMPMDIFDENFKELVVDETYKERNGV